MNDAGHNFNDENASRAGAAPGGRAANSHSGVSRRSFIQTVGLSAAAGAITHRLDAAQQPAGVPEGNESQIVGPEPFRATMRINGRNVRVEMEPSTTLLDALRFHLNMTGSKEICGRGACGGCSMLVDGKLVASCMMLAVDAIGKDVTTVEGLAHGEELDPVQEAFIKHDALQCGYCTPGFIVAGRAILNENPKPTIEEIREGLSGNYCRCGCHCNAFNALLDASGQTPVEEQ